MTTLFSTPLPIVKESPPIAVHGGRTGTTGQVPSVFFGTVLAVAGIGAPQAIDDGEDPSARPRMCRATVRQADAGGRPDPVVVSRPQGACLVINSEPPSAFGLHPWSHSGVLVKTQRGASRLQSPHVRPVGPPDGPVSATCCCGLRSRTS